MWPWWVLPAAARRRFCATSSARSRSEARTARRCASAVVDERGEIAVCAGGEAQMALGTHTDVLTLCPKAQGIGMVLRAMNPQVIAVDEITAEEDLRAMLLPPTAG